MSDKKVEVQGTEKLFSTNFLHMMRADYTIDGDPKQWFYVSRSEEPNEGVDAVDVLALIRNDNGDLCVALNYEYRPAIQSHLYALPSGLVDKDDDEIQVTAARELKEETGLDMADVHIISPALFVSAGLTDESKILIVCDATGQLSTSGQEDTEVSKPMLVPVDALPSLLQETALWSATAWTALSYLHMMLYVNGLNAQLAMMQELTKKTDECSCDGNCENCSCDSEKETASETTTPEDAPDENKVVEGNFGNNN